MSASTRRAALGAILATPLASVSVVALTDNVCSDLPDREARFLAMIPQLRAILPPLEKAKDFCHAVYQLGDDRAGPHPGHSDPTARKAWADRARVERNRLGYNEAYECWNDHALKVDELVAEFMTERMTTLRAIAWKARCADLLDCWEEQAGSDLAAWAKEDASCA